MFFTVIIVIISLVILVAIHELGHFLLAKKFNVRVDEFGIGFPPRIWGKRIGETIYSINWLPLGAFVKILGEDGGSDDPRSFSKKPIWQRALILVGGVVAFWVVAVGLVFFVGAFTDTDVFMKDEVTLGLKDSRVQVVDVIKDSPAEIAGIKEGDILIGFTLAEEFVVFSENNKGKEVDITLQREGEEKEIIVSLVPRLNPPEKEGRIGLMPYKVMNLKTNVASAMPQALRVTYELTKLIPKELYSAIKQKVSGQEVTGVQLVGPVGVVKMMAGALTQGVGSFLMFLVMIAVWLALFNILPIPALDGGRLLFLAIEAARGKPMPKQIEQKLNTIFFVILIALMLVVTLRDVVGLF